MNFMRKIKIHLWQNDHIINKCFWLIVIFIFSFLIGFSVGYKDGAIDCYSNKISILEKDGQYIVNRKTPRTTSSFRDMP